MRRSEINRIMLEAEETFRRHGTIPPPWAAWSLRDWAAHPEQARFCAAHQMGWDITDFGSGDFGRRGLLLLCTRNGIGGVAGERLYAEKLMIVREAQETPFHRHLIKVEDIINRGGGNLIIETDSGRGRYPVARPARRADRRLPSAGSRRTSRSVSRRARASPWSRASCTGSTAKTDGATCWSARSARSTTMSTTTSSSSLSAASPRSRRTSRPATRSGPNWPGEARTGGDRPAGVRFYSSSRVSVKRRSRL